MKGFWKMLTGQGEREYRQEHKSFNDAIPDDYPADMTIEERASRHPAYSGPMANGMAAANYRRAHYMHGPQSKREHAEFAEYQRTHDQNGRFIEDPETREYLNVHGIPLPKEG